MSENKSHEKDPDLLTDEELDAVSGGIVIQNQNLRPDQGAQSSLGSRGIVIDNHPAIIDDNLAP